MGRALTRSVAAGAAVALLAACGASGGPEPICTTEFVYGVRVEAVDPLDDEPVTDDLAGTLSDGDWVESMEADGHWLRGAGERPGSYALTVTADGYRPWSRSGIEVEEGTCHVQPVELRAELTPA